MYMPQLTGDVSSFSMHRISDDFPGLDMFFREESRHVQKVSTLCNQLACASFEGIESLPCTKDERLP